MDEKIFIKEYLGKKIFLDPTSGYFIIDDTPIGDISLHRVERIIYEKSEKIFDEPISYISGSYDMIIVGTIGDCFLIKTPGGVPTTYSISLFKEFILKTEENAKIQEQIKTEIESISKIQQKIGRLEKKYRHTPVEEILNKPRK